MKKILLCSTALIFIIFQLMSCSKKSSSTPTCKISDASASDASTTGTFAITYNDAGQLSTIAETSTSGTTTKVFTYSGNVVQATTTSSTSTDVTTDSIVINSDGLMVSDLNRSGTDVNLSTYTYSGTELQSITSQYDAQAPSTTNYTFTNGDLTGINGTSLTYNDKASAAGDYIQFEQLATTGIPYIKTAHQIVSAQSGSTVQNFNYTYDNSGKITQMVITTGSEVATYNYTYECNQ